MPSRAFLAVYNRRVDILPVDLEVFLCRFSALPESAPFSVTFWNVPATRSRVREPGRVGVGVGVEVIQPGVFHHVVALGVRQSIVGFADAITGEVRSYSRPASVPAKRPFCRRQPAALALEGDVVMPLRFGMRPVCMAAPPGACNSAGRRRRRRSCLHPPACRYLASGCRGLHRHRDRGSPSALSSETMNRMFGFCASCASATNVTRPQSAIAAVQVAMPQPDFVGSSLDLQFLLLDKSPSRSIETISKLARLAFNKSVRSSLTQRGVPGNARLGCTRERRTPL